MGTAPAAVMEPMVVMDCVPVLRGRRESLAGRVKWVVMVRVVKLAPPTQMVTFVRAKVPATEMGLLPAGMSFSIQSANNYVSCTLLKCTYLFSSIFIYFHHFHSIFILLQFNVS